MWQTEGLTEHLASFFFVFFFNFRNGFLLQSFSLESFPKIKAALPSHHGVLGNIPNRLLSLRPINSPSVVCSGGGPATLRAVSDRVQRSVSGLSNLQTQSLHRCRGRMEEETTGQRCSILLLCRKVPKCWCEKIKQH